MTNVDLRYPHHHPDYNNFYHHQQQQQQQQQQQRRWLLSILPPRYHNDHHRRSPRIIIPHVRQLQPLRLTWDVVLLKVVVVFVLVALSQNTIRSVTVSAATATCSTTTINATYYCPNCNGISVKDCLTDCDGYLSSDSKHQICFNRQLFQRHNTNIHDPDHYYHYLWNDLLAAFIWFFIAGIAVSCGVGGGGIFVPLGVLLLQFSPKQAAGLSQCSIFGATLGGLILNASGKHPQEHITDTPGKIMIPNDTNEKNGTSTTTTGSSTNDTGLVVAIQEPLSKLDIDTYTGTFYTRPIIHYDMVLFLAPMEIAGALMGVIVQVLLPNWLYLLLASFVLGITAYKTYGKFKTQRQREKRDEVNNLAFDDVDNVITALQETQPDGEMVVAKTTTPKLDVDGNTDSSTTSTGSSTNALLIRQDTAGTTTGPTTSDESGDNDNDMDAMMSIHDNTGDGGVEIGVDDDDDVNHNKDHQYQNSNNSNIWVDTDEMKTLRQQYLRDDMRQYPKEKIMGLIVIWIIIFIMTLLRGGKGVPSLIGITCESIWYLVLIVLQFAWLLSAAIYYGIQLIQKQRARVLVRYPFQSDDPVWDMKALRFYGICTFAAGALAGLIGIGGGMILGPLMLVMGLHPRVSSASTATMIVLTSSSVAVLFVTSGLVPWSYALFYFMVCFLGAIINKRQIDAYVKRTGRASLLIFILASIILFATLGCIYNLLSGLAAKDWCLDGFNQFCKVSSNDDDNCPVDRALSYGVSLLSN